MNNIKLLRLVRRSNVTDNPRIGIDFFDVQGDLHLYEVDREAVRRLLDATDHSLLRVSVEDRAEETFGLVCDWHFHWRSGKITLQEVEPDDQVVAYSRAVLPHPSSLNYRPIDAWVHLRGKVRTVAKPLIVPSIPKGKFAVYTVDLPDIPGLEVLSPEGQCLYERVGAAREATHA